MFFLFLQRSAGFLTKIVMANSITPYEYGIVTLVAITLPAMLQIVTNLNFNELLSHSQEGKKYFGFTLYFSTILVFLLSLLFVIFNEEIFSYLNLPLNISGVYLTAIIITMLCTSISIDFQGFFTGAKQYSMPGIVVAIPSLARLIMVAFLMWLGITSVSIYILIFALSNLIPIIFIAISGQYRKPWEFSKTINVPSRKMFAFGMAVFIASNFSQIGQYLIRFVVSHELGVEWQGYYDVSQTLSMIMVFAVGTMIFITVPEATNSDKESIYKEGNLADVIRALFAFLVYLALILIFYANFFVVTIFSENYSISADYVPILAIGYLFFFIQTFLTHVNLSLAKRGKQYISLTITPICLVPFFFILTNFLIEFYKNRGYGNGFIGAYVSYTTILIIVTIITICLSPDLRPLKYLFKKIDRLILSFLVPSLLVLYAQPTPIIGILFFTLTCPILIFLTDYIDKKIILNILDR